MGTSPTIESITSLNPEINPVKYKHSCQVGDVNPGEQIPPQETQPTDDQFASNLPLLPLFSYTILLTPSEVTSPSILGCQIYHLWPTITCVAAST